MSSRSIVLALTGVMLLHGVRTQAACSNTVNRTMDFSLISYKDTSGRWVAKVDMEHDGGESDPDVWKVDVQHNTAGCPGSPRVKITAQLTTPPLKPGPGYEYHRGLGYYKLHLVKKTWPEAKAICESEGGHLAIINSEAESQVLKDMITHHPDNVTGSWMFIGFHDMYTEGRYLTVFDEPLKTTGFSRWASANQPDNFGGSSTNPGEDCGSIHRSNGGLNDLTCTRVVPFLCEASLA